MMSFKELYFGILCGFPKVVDGASIFNIKQACRSSENGLFHVFAVFSIIIVLYQSKWKLDVVLVFFFKVPLLLGCIA